MPYTGKCACGAVSFTINAEPVITRQCWCRQCRKSAGGGPANNAVFQTEAIALSGTVESWSYTAASGNTMSHFFCPSCGTGVSLQSSARPHLMSFRFGVLDEPHGLRPAMAIWTGEAPEWAVIDPSIERFETQPPPLPGAS